MPLGSNIFPGTTRIYEHVRGNVGILAH